MATIVIPIFIVIVTKEIETILDYFNLSQRSRKYFKVAYFKCIGLTKPLIMYLIFSKYEIFKMSASIPACVRANTN